MSKASERQDFMAALGGEFGARVGVKVTMRIGRRLLSLARSANRYNELVCDVGLSDAEQKRADRVDAEAEMLAAELSTMIILNGDPRGYPFYIVTPSGECYGDWGQRGLGVPC